MVGPPEFAVIFLIVVLLFGANKLPKLARSAGEAQGQFQKGRKEVEQELSTQAEESSKQTSDYSSDSVETEE